MSSRLDAAVDELAARCLADPDRYGLHLALVVVQGDLVVVRLGKTTADRRPALLPLLMAVIDAAG